MDPIGREKADGVVVRFSSYKSLSGAVVSSVSTLSSALHRDREIALISITSKLCGSAGLTVPFSDGPQAISSSTMIIDSTNQATGLTSFLNAIASSPR
jgi:hypothetical protein